MIDINHLDLSGLLYILKVLGWFKHPIPYPARSQAVLASQPPQSIQRRGSHGKMDWLYSHKSNRWFGGFSVLNWHWWIFSWLWPRAIPTDGTGWDSGEARFGVAAVRFGMLAVGGLWPSNQQERIERIAAVAYDPSCCVPFKGFVGQKT